MSSRRYRTDVGKEIYEEKPSFPVDQGATEPKKRTGVVSGSKNVRLRKWPDKDGEVLAILKEGTKVKVLKDGIETNGFLEVEVAGTFKGFLRSDLCEVKWR